MITEETHRTPRARDPNEVSLALQELTPLSCTIVDRRGRRVRLSSAGYVLRFGKSYRLRFLSSFREEDIAKIRIITPPAFVKVEEELREVDEQGRAIRSIPFKVSLDLWTHIRKLGMGVYSDHLEVAQNFRQGITDKATTFFCPIVARPRWTVVLVAVLLGLFFILLEKVVTGFFSPEQPSENVRIFLEPVLRVESWFWLLGIALVVWIFVNLVNLGLLYKRSRELRNLFRENYPVCVAVEPKG
jgi:hypothetical protein